MKFKKAALVGVLVVAVKRSFMGHIRVLAQAVASYPVGSHPPEFP